MLTLFTDSDTDFTLEDCAEYGYRLISMPYTINNQVMFPCKTSEPFNYKEYYELLKEGVVPTTSSISKETYLEYFRPEFEAGNDIFYVHFSRNMSGSFNNMDEAIKELKEEFKERNIYTVDTKGISALCYVIVKEVGELFKEGKSVQEVLDWAKEEIDHFALYYVADDLKYFARSGRVTGLAGTMGNLIGIRPIIYINNDGKMEVFDKVTGRNKALDYMVNKVEELGDCVKDHLIVIGHAYCDDLANIVTEKLKAKFGDDINIKSILVNPTIGAHCGPNSLGVAFHAKHR